jgi:hypothetical protein
VPQRADSSDAGAGGAGGVPTTRSGGGPHCDGIACDNGRIVVANCIAPPVFCDRRTSGVDCVPSGSQCPRIPPDAGIDGATEDGSADGAIEGGRAISEGGTEADSSDGE